MEGSKLTITFPVDLVDEIIIAELGVYPFHTFQTIDQTVEAFIQKEDLSEHTREAVEEIAERYNCQVQWEEYRDENWNANWESNFDPVDITEDCRIIAPFHNMELRPNDVLINPKMSFGTGHHATTALMTCQLLKEDVQGKQVLDMGSGTGVLAILAAKKGAREVLAIDNHDFSYENAMENCLLNGVEHVDVRLGSIIDIEKGSRFDLILANINRNVLLEQLPAYVEMLRDGGSIMLSGFYKQDVEKMNALAVDLGLSLVASESKNDWCMLKYEKA